jgi:hypothetical protein
MWWWSRSSSSKTTYRVRPQEASFGPEPRSRPFTILDVARYASGCKRACGLALNRKLPPVAGLCVFHRRHILAMGRVLPSSPAATPDKRFLSHGVPIFKPICATFSAILDLDLLRLRFQKCSSLALNQKLPLVSGGHFQLRGAHYCVLQASPKAMPGRCLNQNQLALTLCHSERSEESPTCQDCG